MPESPKLLFVGGSAHGKVLPLPVPLPLTYNVPVLNKPSFDKGGIPALSHGFDTYMLHKFGYGGSTQVLPVYLLGKLISNDQLAWTMLCDAMTYTHVDDSSPHVQDSWNKVPFNEPWHVKYEPEPMKEPEVDHLMIQVGDEKIRWDLNSIEGATLLTWLKQTRGPGTSTC